MKTKNRSKSFGLTALLASSALAPSAHALSINIHSNSELGATAGAISYFSSAFDGEVIGNTTWLNQSADAIAVTPFVRANAFVGGGADSPTRLYWTTVHDDSIREIDGYASSHTWSYMFFDVNAPANYSLEMTDRSVSTIPRTPNPATAQTAQLYRNDPMLGLVLIGSLNASHISDVGILSPHAEYILVNELNLEFGPDHPAGRFDYVWYHFEVTERAITSVSDDAAPFALPCLAALGLVTFRVRRWA